MTRDKQLNGISIRAVREKQRLDQALNAKEFAVLAGVSYSIAREWFRLSGFPAVRGMVFWQDFVLWRRRQAGLQKVRESSSKRNQSAVAESNGSSSQSHHKWPARSAKILDAAH